VPFSSSRVALTVFGINCARKITCGVAAHAFSASSWVVTLSDHDLLYCWVSGAPDVIPVPPNHFIVVIYVCSSSCGSILWCLGGESQACNDSLADHYLLTSSDFRLNTSTCHVCVLDCASCGTCCTPSCVFIITSRLQ